MNPLASYIGKPWRADGEGPDAYSCWGLVRAVFREHIGVEMPHVAVADESADNVRAIKEASRVSGWRPVATLVPQPWDIVVMHSTLHVHCGVITGRGKVLHSASGCGVVCQHWRVATAGMKSQLWRLEK